MDPEIKKELDRQTTEKIDNVQKEMAWEEEKHRIALEKLKMRYVCAFIFTFLLFSFYDTLL